jgi:predicted nucleotidyltransferase
MFQQLIIKVTRALEKSKIPYMIIGGQAVLLYGTPRLTRDIDITLGVNTERLSELLKIVRALKLSIIPKTITDFVTRTMVLPVQEKRSGIRIDFIFSVTAYEQQALRRVKRVKLGQSIVKFTSVEDLIIHKVFSGRPRDLEDIKSILLKNRTLDICYIKQWLKVFDGSSENQPHFLKTFEQVYH